MKITVHLDQEDIELAIRKLVSGHHGPKRWDVMLFRHSNGNKPDTYTATVIERTSDNEKG